MRRRFDRTGTLFVLPYVVLLFVFGLGPAAYSIYQSFVDDRTGTGDVGLSNYQFVLGDFRFWPAVSHVAIYLGIWLPVMVVGVLVFALLLHERASRFSGAMRLLFFLPGAVTGSASILLWYCMLEPSLSPFAPALKAMGLESGNEIFQNTHLTVIFALIAFTTGVGQWIVIMYGALQNISADVLEAAALDGAGAIRTALQIKLPQISKYVLYMVILCLANGLQLFVEPQLIYGITHTAGSPWWSLNQFGYALAFQNGDFGSAAVISLLLLVLSTGAALVLILRTDFFQTEVDR
ncbi:sugar ABC transporter permease [Longispora fulva]|uniref:Multiple sugar transport system permease protein n=1 Tax=Longispora fulva TaxID=619741 RepID=A0A8J7G9Q2_9ACTN|nr:sugar ABC transporter permease [Longispora fulva]MBG6136368.1 multiple sugar transport system permease protein [Longispora fulva]GIG63458.1 sugar ABC transporter permease [Longispora fulva]